MGWIGARAAVRLNSNPNTGNIRRKKMANDGDKLRKLLEKDEAIRWSGSAQPYGIFDEAHKKSTLASIVWGLAVGAILTGGYLWLCASRNIEVKSVILFFTLGFSLLILWGPVSNKKRIAQMKYAITNKRVIALSAGIGKAFAMSLPAPDAVRIVQAGPGTCHILFGSSVANASGKKLLALSMHGQDPEGEDKVKTSKGIVFYNISADAGNMLRALLQPQAVVQKAAA
jgi:predicted membrane channel-forming protein YqfA (hemolysin III family)